MRYRITVEIDVPNSTPKQRINELAYTAANAVTAIGPKLAYLATEIVNDRQRTILCEIDEPVRTVVATEMDGTTHVYPQPRLRTIKPEQQ